MKNRTYNSRLKDISRNLRGQQTDAEKILWYRLRSRQLENSKFRRQMPIGKYVVDFHCHQEKLAIELDGGHHADQNEKDRRKSAFLQSRGLKVLRFWNNEVYENIEGILLEIRKHLT